MGRRAEHVLERMGRLLRLGDALGRLCDPQRDELGAELVEVAGESGLLGHLAERGDRDGVPYVPPLPDRFARVVERDPRPFRVVRPERADVHAGAGEGLGREHPAQLPAVAERSRGRRDPLEIGRETSLHDDGSSTERAGGCEARTQGVPI